MKVLRTGAILILLSVVLVVAGGAIGGRGGMQIALVIAVVMNFVSYFFSDKIALKSSGAQPVTREQLPRLYQVMERSGRQSEYSGAETLCGAGCGAECVCHGPQSESRVGGGHAGLAANYE